jgi:hypothetical protein
LKTNFEVKGIVEAEIGRKRVSWQEEAQRKPVHAK